MSDNIFLTWNYKKNIIYKGIWFDEFNKIQFYFGYSP